MQGNTVSFEVTGDLGMFANPIMRVGGEKISYEIPTYEAIKGILHSVYWKPSLIWIIDKVRVLDRIEMEAIPQKKLVYSDGSKADLSYYTYLRNCRYQVQAHFIWNENRPELAQDRNVKKHAAMAARWIKRGGRRDIFLGTRECQGYVEPCVFGEGYGYYDHSGEIFFGNMYHGITYADEAYPDKVPETEGMMTKRFWIASMKDGVISFPAPWECTHIPVRRTEMKPFGIGSTMRHIEREVI